MKTQQIYNLIILDESGSMSSIKKQTINGFNEVVQTIKGIEERFPEQEHFISLVTFNTFGIKTLLFNSLVKELKEISGSSYNPNAGTPLYDAMGMAINRQKESITGNLLANVLVTVITDGEENSSKEFTGYAIKKIIDELKQLNWTFTYIGANHDVDAYSKKLSIDNSLIFESDERGTHQVFLKEKSSRIAYSMKLRKGENVKEDYFKDMDDDNVDIG